jgi:hypothetical protein
MAISGQPVKQKQGFKVSRFQGFKVSKFQGLRVSKIRHGPDRTALAGSLKP